MPRFNKRWVTLLVTFSFFAAQPAFAMAPPPAFSFCAISPLTCKFDDGLLPEFHFKVGTLDIIDATPATLAVTADNQNKARVLVSYYDKNNKFDASTNCTATRTLPPPQDIVISGQLGPTPWDIPMTQPAPITYGNEATQLPVIFSNVPKGKVSSPTLKISCVHAGKTYVRNVKVAITGAPLPPGFHFTVSSVPIIPWDSTTKFAHPIVKWDITGNVGTCIIADQSPSDGGRFTPKNWLGDAYIKNWATNNNHTESVPNLRVYYPTSPGKYYTYTFDMSCSNVTGHIVRAITAERRNGGNIGGGGRTYNYSDGSTRFE